LYITVCSICSFLFFAFPQNCTYDDIVRVESAIAQAFAQQGTRNLRSSTAQRGRGLQVCTTVCRYLTRYTCQSNYPGCHNWANVNCPASTTTLCDRRKLQQESATLLILDDIFYSDDKPVPGVPGDRQLLETTCGVSEVDCIRAKAALYQAVLSALGDVDTTCANLLLAPGLLQCIVEVIPE
jgi:hypothetical protein